MPEYFRTIREGEASIARLKETIRTASSNAIKPFAAQTITLVQRCLELSRKGVHKAVINREGEAICSCSLISPKKNLKKEKGHLDLAGNEVTEFIFENEDGEQQQITQKSEGNR